MLPHTVYLGLGSNLDGPLKQLQTAIRTIDQHPQMAVEQVSSFYQSSAIGPDGQDDYINAVASIITSLDPMALLSTLQGIEDKQLRNRSTERWGPRTLDLDILLYNDETINEENLQIPHPQLELRNFVLIPLSEIASTLILPSSEAVAILAEKCDKTGIRMIVEKA